MTTSKGQTMRTKRRGIKAMTKKFIKKVKLYGVVDTRKYRYVYRNDGASAWIDRLPIQWLDTTRAINEWETVKRF